MFAPLSPIITLFRSVVDFVSLAPTLITGLLGSNVLVALFTARLSKRKTHAEATDITVKTALELERRAHDRYKDVSATLEEAERLLRSIRVDLQEQEHYISFLRGILDDAGLEYPSKDGWRRDNECAD